MPTITTRNSRHSHNKSHNPLECRGTIFVTAMAECQDIADADCSSDEPIKRIQKKLLLQGRSFGYNRRLPHDRGNFLSTCSPCSFRSVFHGIPKILIQMPPTRVSAVLRDRLDSCMKVATPAPVVLYGEEWRDVIVEGKEGEELRGTTLPPRLQWPQVSNLGRYRDMRGVVTQCIRNNTERNQNDSSPITSIRLGGLLSYNGPYAFGAPIPPVTPLIA